MKQVLVSGLQTLFTTLHVRPPLLGSLFTVAVNCWVPPDSTEALFGEIPTVMLEVVIVAEPVLVVSVTEVAVTVTVSTPGGGLGGAVYIVPLPLSVEAGEKLPQGDALQVAVHVTPLFSPSFVSVAEKFAVAPAGMVPVLGETETAMGGRTVIGTVCDFVGSLAEAAVRLTERLPATDAGGVYVVGVPLAVDVGETVPQDAAEQDKLQFIPLFEGSLATVAENCAVKLVFTVCGASEKDTLMGGGGGALVPEPPHPELLAAMTAAIPTAANRSQFFDFMANLPPDSSRVFPIPCLVASSDSASYNC